MAVLIGRTKGWLWWLGGLVCALAFGSRADAGQAVALYGVRVRPPGPPINEKAATEAEKKKAGELVEAWMAGEKPAEPGAEEKAQIAKLIESFGSNSFQTREAASKEIVKFGGKALGQLKEALASKDAEVRTRASGAIATINSGVGRAEIQELRKVRNAAHVVIRAQMSEFQKQGYKANLEARALQKQGKEDEAARKRQEAAAAYKESGRLGRLYSLVIYGGVITPGVARPKYGVQVRPLPAPLAPIEGRVQGGAEKKVEARK